MTKDEIADLVSAVPQGLEFVVVLAKVAYSGRWQDSLRGPKEAKP
jgi:hypothetical protein